MEKFPQLLRKYFIFVIKNKHFVTTCNISNNCHVKSVHKTHQIHLSNLVMSNLSTNSTKHHNVKSGTMSKTVKNSLKKRKITAFAPIPHTLITTLLQKPSDWQGFNKCIIKKEGKALLLINNIWNGKSLQYRQQSAKYRHCMWKWQIQEGLKG